MLLGKGNLIFCCPGTSGWSVSKIIITILSFRVGTSENKKYGSLMLFMKATTSLYSMIQQC